MAVKLFQNEDIAIQILSNIPLRGLLSFRDSCITFRKAVLAFWKTETWLDFDNFAFNVWLHGSYSPIQRLFLTCDFESLLGLVVKLFPNLHSISISSAVFNSNKALIQVLCKFPRLKSVSINGELILKESLVSQAIWHLQGQVQKWNILSPISNKNDTTVSLLHSLFKRSELRRFSGETTSKISQLLCQNVQNPKLLECLTLKTENPDTLGLDDLLPKCSALTEICIVITEFCSSETSMHQLFDALSCLNLHKLCLKFCAVPKHFSKPQLCNKLRDFFSKQVHLQELELSLFPVGNEEFTLCFLNISSEFCRKSLKSLSIKDEQQSAKRLLPVISTFEYLSQISLSVDQLYGGADMSDIFLLPLQKLELRIVNSHQLLYEHCFLVRFDLSGFSQLEELHLHMCDSSNLRPLMSDVSFLAKNLPTSTKTLTFSNVIAITELEILLSEKIEALSLDRLVIDTNSWRPISQLCPLLKKFSIRALSVSSAIILSEHYSMEKKIISDLIENCEYFGTLKVSHAFLDFVSPLTRIEQKIELVLI